MKQKKLQFHCHSCKENICFSLSELDKKDPILSCTKCNKKYAFSDQNLIRQLKKFEALCQQIQESEEILSHTAVGVNIAEHQIKIPFKLLLTRMSSHLDLMIGDQPISFNFRIEPLKSSYETT